MSKIDRIKNACILRTKTCSKDGAKFQQIHALRIQILIPSQAKETKIIINFENKFFINEFSVINHKIPP